MNSVMQTLRPAVSVFALLTALTGVAYPLLVTGIAQAAFPHAANGSVLSVDGKAVGSALRRCCAAMRSSTGWAG